MMDERAKDIMAYDFQMKIERERNEYDKMLQESRRLQARLMELDGQMQEKSRLIEALLEAFRTLGLGGGGVSENAKEK